MDRVQPIVRKLVQHSYSNQGNDCKRCDHGKDGEPYRRVREPIAVVQTISPQPDLHRSENEGYVYY
jgi:hypothetical protein